MTCKRRRLEGSTFGIPLGSGTPGPGSLVSPVVLLVQLVLALAADLPSLCIITLDCMELQRGNDLELLGPSTPGIPGSALSESLTCADVYYLY